MTYLDPAWRDRHIGETDAHRRLPGILERLAVMLEEEELSPEGRRPDSEVWQLLRSVMQEMGVPCPELASAPSVASYELLPRVRCLRYTTPATGEISHLGPIGAAGTSTNTETGDCLIVPSTGSLVYRRCSDGSRIS